LRLLDNLEAVGNDRFAALPTSRSSASLAAKNLVYLPEGANRELCRVRSPVVGGSPFHRIGDDKRACVYEYRVNSRVGGQLWDTLYPAVSCEMSERTFREMFQYKAVIRLNQYFSTQVVAISTLENCAAGNLSKHWSLGRGGGDRNNHRLAFQRLTK